MVIIESRTGLLNREKHDYMAYFKVIYYNMIEAKDQKLIFEIKREEPDNAGISLKVSGFRPRTEYNLTNDEQRFNLIQQVLNKEHTIKEVTVFINQFRLPESMEWDT